MIEAIVERLEQNAPAFSSISVAEDLDALAAGTAPDHGACFVVPYREKARPNKQGYGDFRQTVDVQFFVAFVVRHHGDVRGKERAKAFDNFKASSEQALAGWEVQPGSNLCALVNSEGTSLGNGASVYVQLWETTRFLTGA